MAMFIDRHAELDFLQNVLTRTRPGPGQLILLYGRRRVGKTALLGISTAREQKVALAKTVTKFFSCEKDQYRRNMICVPHWSAKSRCPLLGHQRPLSQQSRRVAAYVRARCIGKKPGACLARSMVLPENRTHSDAE